MQFWGYLADIVVYCVFTLICTKVLIKEMALDYEFRREISKGYAIFFLPFLSLPLVVVAVNSIYIMHQCSKVTPHVKSYYHYISPYLSSKIELWIFSSVVISGYALLKFIYHFKLRREIAKRNESILTEIENLAMLEEENSKTPNHIEYL